jgi:hypothetical protein
MPTAGQTTKVGTANRACQLNGLQHRNYPVIVTADNQLSQVQLN